MKPDNLDSSTSMNTPMAAPPPRRASNAALAALCLILAVMLPLLVAGYLATAPAHALTGSLGLPASSPLSAPGFQMSALQRFIVLVAGLAPIGFMAVALIRARRCFHRFSRGEYFTPGVVHALRGCAGAMFLSGVAGLLVPPMASVLLSAAGGGGLSLTLSVGSGQVLLLLFAGIVWQISAVMARAVVLANEHAQFV